MHTGKTRVEDAAGRKGERREIERQNEIEKGGRRRRRGKCMHTYV